MIDADGDLVVGIDEAGRGPLAGPVVAAAVVLDVASPAGLGDSKALTARQRERLATEIMREARAWALGMAEVEEIDRLNIHHASLLAMQRAVAGLALRPTRALVDGRFCPLLACPATPIVGGDASEPAISAASILAKVHRDHLMVALHRQFPAYGFDRHKGYPTAAHLAALSRDGISPVHRRSYAPVRRLLEAGGAR